MSLSGSSPRSHRVRGYAMLAVLAVSLAVGIAAAQAGDAATREQRAARRGLAFAERHCSGCHAVRPGVTSDNPESPPFEDIANREGTTRATLRRFLRDSHNFPEAMNFRVDARRIDELARYLITLRRPAYKPEQ